MSNIQDKVIIIRGLLAVLEKLLQENLHLNAKLVLADRRENRLKRLLEEMRKNGGQAV